VKKDKQRKKNDERRVLPAEDMAGIRALIQKKQTRSLVLTEKTKEEMNAVKSV